MSTGQIGETADLRASILARCDEMERLARLAHYVADPDDDGQDDGQWDSHGSGVVTDDQMRRVTNPSPGWMPTVRADAVGAHVATWDPAAALALVAGAREMCEVHRPDDDPLAYNFGRLPEVGRRDCRGCGYGAHGEYAMHQIADCPTLAALARMLGVEVRS